MVSSLVYVGHRGGLKNVRSHGVVQTILPAVACERKSSLGMSSYPKRNRWHVTLKVLDMEYELALLVDESPFFRVPPYRFTTVFWRVANKVSAACDNRGYGGLFDSIIVHGRA